MSTHDPGSAQAEALLRSLLFIRDAHRSAGSSGSTKERVVLAAVELIAVNGYRATSMRQVADRAGVRAPSIYNHFASKDALVAAAMEWVLDNFMTFVAAPMERRGDLWRPRRHLG